MGQFVGSHRTQLHITMYKLIVLSVVLVAASAQIAVPAGYGYAGPVHAAGRPYPYAAGHTILPAAGDPLTNPHPQGVLPHEVPTGNIIGRIAGAPEAINFVLPAPRIVEEAPIVAQSTEKVEQHGYSIRY